MPEGLTRLRPAAVLTAANVVTFARLCAAPVVVWLILRGRLSPALALFVLVALSDALDGWLARRGGASALGAVLDPAADKLLLVSSFVTLAAVHELPDWLAILVVFRDLVVVGGVLVMRLLGRAVAIRPSLASKLSTALQMGLVVTVLARQGVRGGLWDPWVDGLVLLVTGVTLLSGGAYVLQAVRGR